MSEASPRNVVPFREPGQRSGAERLESWKEIAAYLKRGTRTVQRWEREEGLPIHRLHHELGSTVYAFRPELDAWWSSRQTGGAEAAPPMDSAGPSIAVLPFADMSREKDQEYFCEGMAEEIINALSRVEGLRVASRTSAFRFRGSGQDSREIGRRLGVRTLLEGSVRKAGNQLRIAVQLTNCETGYQIWSARYDREMKDVFAVQDEIAGSLVEALQVTLTAEGRGRRQKAPTTDAQAYDYYLRGRKFYYGYDRRDVEFAIELFTHAVDLDPHYVLAHAGLADCWSYLYLYAERTEDYRRRADASSGRAVELDPGSAQAQASRGVALSLGGRDPEAEQAFETALRLDPLLFEAPYFYARHSFVRGHLDKAVRLYERAIEVQPEDYQAPLLMAQIYEDLGRNEDASAVRRRGIEIAEQHLKLNPDDARAVYMMANGLVALGERGRGLEAAARALAMRPDEPMVLYNVGCIYSMLGKIEPALECLENAARHGLRQQGWFAHDSNLDAVRGHPRFQKLMRLLE